MRKLLIFLMAALTLAACSSTPAASSAVPAPVSSTDLTKVTLRVGDQKGGSQALLTAAGLVNTPYHIQWSTFTSGPPLLEAANAGAIDIGAVGNTPPLFSAAANAKIAVVAASQGPVTGDAILVPKDSAIQTLAQLRGKTIAVAKGSSAHGHLLLALKKAGLTPADVKISYLQPADAYAAFSQRQVDAWTIWDPYTSQALQQADARVLVNGTGLSNGYGFNVAGRASLADAGKNSAMQDYVLRLAKASVWAAGHLSTWASVWSQQTGLASAVAQAAVANTTRRPVTLTSTLIASEQGLADSFVTAKVLPTEFTFADFVD